VSLTIYNKAVLGKVGSSPFFYFQSLLKFEEDTTDTKQFAYPWLLTTLHALSASSGCYILLLRGTFHLTKLSYQENPILALFSFLFTINIAISNVSLYVVLSLRPFPSAPFCSNLIAGEDQWYPCLSIKSSAPRNQSSPYSSTGSGIIALTPARPTSLSSPSFSGWDWRLMGIITSLSLVFS
jgi:hypothetical protein